MPNPERARRPLWRAVAGGAPGVVLLIAAWQAINLVWGPFVLPSPWDSARAFVRLAGDGTLAIAALETALSAIGGFLAGTAIGLALGLAGGLSETVGRGLAPAVTLILGVPPIAWVVLSLLWFGSDGGGPAMTAALTIFPIVFAATVQGVRTADHALADMARAFGAGVAVGFLDVRLPQLLSHLFPALATAHGIAWKATVMAEVMGSGRGLGGALATARATLDLPAAMAVIGAAALLLLALDGLVLAPLRRRGERWRDVR
jgi:NitT/TauT family transport system permease protein